jgi:hypothetical protein
LQPTPLRVDKIVPILRVRISYNVFSIYWRGAAERQTVGWRLIKASSDHYIGLIQCAIDTSLQPY